MNEPPAHDEMRPVSEEGRSTTSSSEPGVAGELQSDARQLGSKVSNRLHSEVDARKDSAVTQAKSISTAIQRTADGLDDNAPGWLKSAFRQGADQVQRFADSIEQKDSRQILSEVQSFARNSPGTFLAACAAAGFVAARVLKAGGETATGSQRSWGNGPAVGNEPGTAENAQSAPANVTGDYV